LGSGPVAALEDDSGLQGALQHQPSDETLMWKKTGVSAQGGTGVRYKEADKVAWKCLSDPVRDNCVGKIYDGLCFETAPEVGQ